MFSRKDVQELAAQFIIHNPRLSSFLVLAVNFSVAVGMSEYIFKEKIDSSPCKKRIDYFKGFGSLETKQCDPVIEVYRISNATLTNMTAIALAFFQSSSMKHLAGSATLVQVPLESLQKKLINIVPKIISIAEQDNPPLEPFPADFDGSCKISMKPGASFSTYAKRGTVLEPDRNIEFVFQGLNEALCNKIVDFLKSEELDSENTTRVSNLDAGKAFVVIAMILAVSLSLAGLYYAVTHCPKVKIPSFFRSRRENIEESIPADSLENKITTL